MSADIESWPEKAELERWLMNTVKDPDPGALFLRQVLQMNPAYGGYLQTDKDLVQIVQLTAKRLRARMMSASGPLSPSSFYEPLCEMTWRITGHLLHAVLVLDSTAANSLPVPKEPLGQVKMLVQTNMELSQKLNMMRRDYLRELTSHRDKQRTISDEAHGVLESLQENPVMFFEPLKFVLDDVTKEFIKLVVEERVKLDQKGAPVPKPERKPTREMTNPKAKTSEKEKALQDDLNKVRSQLAKLQEAFKESEIQVRRLDAAEKSVREQLERAEEQRSNAARQATAQSKALEEELRLLRQQLEEKDRAMDQLKAMGSMEEKSKMEALAQRTKELSEAKAAVAELTSQVAKVNEELSSLQQQLKEADEMRLVSEALAKEAKAKVPQAPQVEVTEDKSEALAEELGEALEAAKTLRKEKGQLEKALEEARAVQANLQAQLAKKQEASPKVQVQKKEEEKIPTPRAPKVEVQEEPAPVPPKEETPAPRVVEVAVAVPNEDLEMWKDKCTNLEDEKVDLENQIADLTQQVKILTEKLQEVGGEQAILEVQEKIKLAIPRPPKKKKPKRAYERLWQDAQRRIIAMRVQAKVLEKNQEQQIVAWRKNAVANENSMKIIESISRMHHDASTSQTALNQAMEDYSIETAPDQEVHDVWDDDEADETPSPVSGAKYNFETEEGMELNEADEVEVLRTELLHRQQELRALKQEVAVLRRTLEMSDAESYTSHPRASVKPFMAGSENASLRYVPPHERPLPKGERYDPSQAGSNYLQQLQQMQQSSKDASAKDASKDSSRDSSNQRPSIMKFKRAVDLIRKSKPDVSASLKSESSRPILAASEKTNRQKAATDRPFSASFSVASLGAEISASSSVSAVSAPALSGSASAPLARMQQTVKKVPPPGAQPLQVEESTGSEFRDAGPPGTSRPSSRPTTASVASGEPTQLFPLTLPLSSAKSSDVRHPPSPRPELGPAGPTMTSEDLQPTTFTTVERTALMSDARPESRTTSISSACALPPELQTLMKVELPELIEQASREGSKKEMPTPPQGASRQGSKNCRHVPEPEEIEEALARPSAVDEATAPPAVPAVPAVPWGPEAPGSAPSSREAPEALEALEASKNAMEPPSGASSGRQPSNNSSSSPRPVSQSREASKNSLGAPRASSQPSKNSTSSPAPSRGASKTSAIAAPVSAVAPPMAASQREASKSEIITPPAVAPGSREASKNAAIPTPAKEASKNTRQSSPGRTGSREPSQPNMTPPSVASHAREPSKNSVPSPGPASREPSKNLTSSPGVASHAGSREPSKNAIPSPSVASHAREPSKNSVPSPGPASREPSKNLTSLPVAERPERSEGPGSHLRPSQSKSAATTGLTEVEAERAPNLATVLSYKPEMPAKREGSPVPAVPRARSRTGSASVSPARSSAGREVDAFPREARQPSRDDSGRRPATVPNRELGAGNVAFFIGEAPNLDVRHKASPKPSKEVPVSHAATELALGRTSLRGQARPFGSRCKTSPLPALQADFGGGHLLSQGEGTPTNNFPIRTRSSRDRFGSDEWDPAPVKPRAKGLMVTAMRSQEWMSQVASEPGDE